MRIIDTPLNHAVPPLAPRESPRLDPALVSAFRMAPGTEAILTKLRQPGALVVTTGQQPGLFTGPLYTVYKALSAATLAERLESQWGQPVVPVFWLASDDHDYNEARRIAWIGSDGDLIVGALADRLPEAPLTPMYRAALGEDVVAVVETFAASFPATPDRDETVAWLRRHYSPGRTVGEAYGGALAELLAPLGILCLETTDPVVKRAMAPYLLAALESADAIDRELGEAAANFERRGRAVPVTVGDGATLVFLEDGAGRDRLVADHGALVSRRAGTRHTLHELRAVAASAPERLSPNVLLRPVVESALLPTIAYVAGPGELSYFDLCGPIYDRLSVPRQLPVPRWSGLVVEPRVDRVLGKFKATLEELLAPGNALEARVVHSRLPPQVLQASERLRRVIEAEYGVLHAEAVGIDPTLDRPLGAARHHALTGLQEVERKLEQHLKKREATELGQIGRARAAVQPAGRPQERVLTVAGFLARYGPPFLEAVRDRIRTWYGSALAGGPAVS